MLPEPYQSQLTALCSQFEENLKATINEAASRVQGDILGMVNNAFVQTLGPAPTEFAKRLRGMAKPPIGVVKYDRADFEEFAGRLPPLPTSVMAWTGALAKHAPPKVLLRNAGGYQGGDHRPLDPTLEADPKKVAKGWRWCAGAGKKHRHMWNIHTVALDLFPRPNRRAEMKLAVVTCPWHKPVDEVVAQYGLSGAEAERLRKKHKPAKKKPAKKTQAPKKGRRKK